MGKVVQDVIVGAEEGLFQYLHRHYKIQRPLALVVQDVLASMELEYCRMLLKIQLRMGFFILHVIFEELL